MRYLIVTGMSGSGKSVAQGVLEDMGYYCIDNMPVALISKFAELYAQTGSRQSNVAFIIDVRGESNFRPLEEEVESMKASGYECKVLVLDCSSDVLLNRYKETRRIHPLSALYNIPISEAIEKERQLLENIFEKADYIIDSTYLTVHQMREKIQDVCGNQKKRSLTINVISFGFKNGSVKEADLVFDVRCFPNPFYVSKLRNLTGLDPEVREYVMEMPRTKTFLEKLCDMIDFLLPLYSEEGKRQLTVAIGCTGGKHRSVTIAEALATHLRDGGESVSVIHRDIKNGKQ